MRAGELIRCSQPIILSHKASAYNFSGTGFGLQAFTTLPLYHNHGRAYSFRSADGQR